jgi:phage-related protein
MRYMENKKAQGFDTFKLLIAAVVAMVILGIVTGVFEKIWEMINGLSCVSSAVNELTTTIQSATTGLTKSSGTICFSEGESLPAEKISSRLSNVLTVKYDCKGASVCSGDPPMIDVTDSNILIAKSDATMQALVDCEDSTGNGFDCTITILNA